MIAPLLKTLSEERIIFLEPSKVARLPFALNGIIRLVDKKGNTLAIVLDKNTIDDIEEEIEASSPKFLDSLAKSRKSGRKSGKLIKKKIGIK